MSDLLYYAKQYADAGLAVFPLWPGKKTPITEHGFKDATTDTAVISNWWRDYPEANIGIATGDASEGIFVVDQDEKHGEHGIDEFTKWVQENHLEFSETWEVSTPSGGRHTYFRTTENVPNRAGWLPGVDIRGTGGYVVVPPSVLSEGGSYEWVNDSFNKIHYPLSADDAEDICVVVKAINKSKAPAEQPSDPTPEIITSGKRNDTLYRSACSMQAKGFSNEAILAAVMAENEAKCKPPLAADEVSKIVSSALTKQKGTATKDDSSIEENKFDFPLMKPLSARELMAMDIPETVKYVGVDAEVPLLSEGSCVLASKAKTGKSWFCTNLCWALTTGSDFLGYKTKKCKVQYYDLEQDEGIEQGRLNKVSEALSEEVPEGFFIRTKLQRLGHGLVEQLEFDMKNNPEIGVFIIDVFEKVRTQKRQTESDYTYTYRDFDRVNDFAKQHHVAIVLLFHTRKTVDVTDPFADILGSTAIQGASNQMIVIAKDKYNARNTKLFAKGRTMDGLIELEYVLENGIITVADAEKAVDEDSTEEFLMSEIRTAVVTFMEKAKYFKGKCSGLVTECARAGIGIDAAPLTIGKFLGKHIGKFMKYDHIFVEVINNGTGGKTYALTKKPTVDTVDGWVPTVDENPFEGA